MGTPAYTCDRKAVIASMDAVRTVIHGGGSVDEMVNALQEMVTTMEAAEPDPDVATIASALTMEVEMRSRLLIQHGAEADAAEQRALAVNQVRLLNRLVRNLQVDIQLAASDTEHTLKVVRERIARKPEWYER